MHKQKRLYFTTQQDDRGRWYYEIFDRKGRDVEVDPGDHGSKRKAQRTAANRVAELTKS